MMADCGGRRAAQRRRVVAEGTRGDEVPLLVTLLAGNPATAAAILTCLNAGDTRSLRQLHPAVAAVVAGVPWNDTGSVVVDVVRWRAALPAAVGAKVTRLLNEWDELLTVTAALAGVVVLSLAKCDDVTDAVLLNLPVSLRSLNVSKCEKLTNEAIFAHLTALEDLDCGNTEAVYDGTAGLPSSLVQLRLDNCDVPPDSPFSHLTALRVLDCSFFVEYVNDTLLASLPPSLEVADFSCVRWWSRGMMLAHLPRLRVLKARCTPLDDPMLASLPPCLEELDVSDCSDLTPAASFAHLHALQELRVRECGGFGDAALATLPPSLVSLDASMCVTLTPAAVLPHLPALRTLIVSDTDIGDATLASLPAGLLELNVSNCRRVTHAATLDHLAALQLLQSYDADLSPAALHACRARGCVAPADVALRGHSGSVAALALMPDGRLASCSTGGEVLLWDAGREGEAVAVFYNTEREESWMMAALSDGRRLALCVTDRDAYGWKARIEVWDVALVPPVHKLTIDCGRTSVKAVVQLPYGCLAFGGSDGEVRVVDVDTGTTVARLEEHAYYVAALVVLPDGRLASASWDATVRVWDTGARRCRATLVGHTAEVLSLAVLADGRLASGACDSTVRLWDVRARACVGVLRGEFKTVSALVGLPDGRLAGATTHTNKGIGTIRLWDTRPAAAAAAVATAVHAADTAPGVLLAPMPCEVPALLLLPDGRLAAAQEFGLVRLVTVPPPTPLLDER